MIFGLKAYLPSKIVFNADFEMFNVENKTYAVCQGYCIKLLEHHILEKYKMTFYKSVIYCSSKQTNLCL